MLKVGLTGGIGSGKSFAAKLFKEKGVTIVNADDVAREVVTPGSKALPLIVQHFGKDILTSDGNLNRRLLRSIIFDNLQEKKWLEALLHPLIRKKIVTKLQIAPPPYCILESPLLFETEQNKLVDKAIVVDLPIELQIKRASLRDDQTRNDIRKITEQQMKREERLNKADFVLNNGGTKELLKDAVHSLHEKLIVLADN